MPASPKRRSKQGAILLNPKDSPSCKASSAFLIIGLCIIFSAFVIAYQSEKLQLFVNYKSSHEVKYRGEDEKRDTNAAEIKAISILGERNSGTTWMYEHLKECFDHSIPVNRQLTRYKHWFQDEHIVDNRVTNGTLVLAMFRNPFEWIEAMRARPHHASEHIHLGWEEFVTKPWTMERVGFDLNMTEDEKNDPKACQEDFMYRDIISCHVRPYPKGSFEKTYMSNHQPFYEMRNDGSGDPFKNILEMRAAKNLNFLSVKDYRAVKELWLIQYEALSEGGTAEVIRDIEKMTGATAKCRAYPPQNRKRRNISKDEIKYIEEHVSWEAENAIGYSKTGLRKPKHNSTIYRKIVSL